MTLFRAFLFSVAVGLIGVSLSVAFTRQPSPRSPPVTAGQARIGHVLMGDISVSEQVSLEGLATLPAAGFRTLIDLRPDGEAPDQPSSTEVGATAAGISLNFAYIPIPHGDIPDGAVTELARVLATAERPVLLYCRSGKRAARVWALAEAVRPSGSDATSISAAVRSVGQPVDDLLPAIQIRIAARKP